MPTPLHRIFDEIFKKQEKLVDEFNIQCSCNLKELFEQSHDYESAIKQMNEKANNSEMELIKDFLGANERVKQELNLLSYCTNITEYVKKLDAAFSSHTPNLRGVSHNQNNIFSEHNSAIHALHQAGVDPFAFNSVVQPSEFGIKFEKIEEKLKSQILESLSKISNLLKAASVKVNIPSQKTAVYQTIFLPLKQLQLDSSKEKYHFDSSPSQITYPKVQEPLVPSLNVDTFVPEKLHQTPNVQIPIEIKEQEANSESIPIQTLIQEERAYFFSILKKIKLDAQFMFQDGHNDQSLLPSVIQWLKQIDALDIDDENSKLLLKKIFTAAHLLFCSQFHDYQNYFQEWIKFLLKQLIPDYNLLFQAFRLGAQIDTLRKKKAGISRFNSDEILSLLLDRDADSLEYKKLRIGLHEINRDISSFKNGGATQLNFYPSFDKLSDFFTENGITYQTIPETRRLFQNKILDVCVAEKGLLEEIFHEQECYKKWALSEEEKLRQRILALSNLDVLSQFNRINEIYTSYINQRNESQSVLVENIFFEAKPIQKKELLKILAASMWNKNDNDLVVYFNKFEKTEMINHPEFMEFLHILLMDNDSKIVYNCNPENLIALIAYLIPEQIDLKNLNSNKSLERFEEQIVAKRFKVTESIEDYLLLVKTFFSSGFYFEYAKPSCKEFFNNRCQKKWTKSVAVSEFQFLLENFYSNFYCSSESNFFNNFIQSNSNDNKALFFQSQFENFFFTEPLAFLEAFASFQYNQALQGSYDLAFDEIIIKPVLLLRYLKQSMDRNNIKMSIEYQKHFLNICMADKELISDLIDLIVSLFKEALNNQHDSFAKKIALTGLTLGTLVGEREETENKLIKEINLKNANSKNKLINFLNVSFFELKPEAFIIGLEKELKEFQFQINKMYQIETFSDHKSFLSLFAPYQTKESSPSQFLMKFFESAIDKITEPELFLVLIPDCGKNVRLQNFLYEKFIEKYPSLTPEKSENILEEWMNQLKSNELENLGTELLVFGKFSCHLNQLIEKNGFVSEILKLIGLCDNESQRAYLEHYFEHLKLNRPDELEDFFVYLVQFKHLSLANQFVSEIIGKKIIALKAKEKSDDLIISLCDEYLFLTDSIQQLVKNMQFQSYPKNADAAVLSKSLEKLLNDIFNDISHNRSVFAQLLVLNQEILKKASVVDPDASPSLVADLYSKQFKELFEKSVDFNDCTKTKLLAHFFISYYNQKKSKEIEINEKYQKLQDDFHKDVTNFLNQKNELNQKINDNIKQIENLKKQIADSKEKFTEGVALVVQAAVFPKNNESAQQTQTNPIQPLQTDFLALSQESFKKLEENFLEKNQFLTDQIKKLEELQLDKNIAFSDENAKKLFKNNKAIKMIDQSSGEAFSEFNQMVSDCQADMHQSIKKIYDQSVSILKEKASILAREESELNQKQKTITLKDNDIATLNLSQETKENEITALQEVGKLKKGSCLEKQEQVKKQNQLMTRLEKNLKKYNEKISESVKSIMDICEYAISCRQSIGSGIKNSLIYRLADFFSNSRVDKLRQWSEKVLSEAEVKEKFLNLQINEIKECKDTLQKMLISKGEDQSILEDPSAPQSQNSSDATRIRETLSVLEKCNILENDPYIGFFDRWFANRQLSQMRLNIQKPLEISNTLTLEQSNQKILVDEIASLNSEINTGNTNLTSLQSFVEKTQQEKSQLEQDKATLQKSCNEASTLIGTLSPAIKKLEETSLKLYELLSPAWVEVLHNTALSAKNKLKTLEELDKGDKLSAFNVIQYFSGIVQRNGKDSCFSHGGNVFYHVIVSGAEPEILDFFIKKISQSEPNALSSMVGSAIMEVIKFHQNQENCPNNVLLAIYHLLRNEVNLNHKEQGVLWLFLYNYGSSDQMRQLFKAHLKSIVGLFDSYNEAVLLFNLAAQKGDKEIIDFLFSEKHAISDTTTGEQKIYFESLINSSLPLEEKVRYINKISLKKLKKMNLSYDHIRDDLGNTLLHEAIKSGNTILVEYFCQVSPQLIKIKNKQGKLPLDIAVEHAKIDIVQHLLDQWLACLYSFPSINRLFIHPIYYQIQSSSLNTLSSEKDNDFFESIQNSLLTLISKNETNDVDISLLKTFFKSLFQQKFIYHEVPTDLLKLKGDAYRYLTACGSDETFNLLLEQDFDFNACDEKTGNTVLHQLVLDKDLVKIKTLIDKGADVDKQNIKGQTPLMLLYETMGAGGSDILKNRAIIDYLIEQSMYHKVAGSNLPSVSILQRPIFSQQDSQGLSLLHYAAKCGDLVTIKKFVETKSNLKLDFTNFLEIRDQQGKTPVHYWVAHSKKDMVIKGLNAFEAKSNIHLRDNQGKMPLHDAFNSDVVVHLIKQYGNNTPALSVNDLAIHADRIINREVDENQQCDIRKIYQALHDAVSSEADKKLVNEMMQCQLAKLDLSNLDKMAVLTKAKMTKSKVEYQERLSAVDLKDELISKIISKEYARVAAILDKSPHIALPDDVNRDYFRGFDVDNLDSRSFWVSVIALLEGHKRLVFQDCKTKHTLLHALVVYKDLENFIALDQADGIEYVTQKDEKGKTVMDYVRDDAKNNILKCKFYTTKIEAGQKTIYHFVLDSIYLRLKKEFSLAVAQSIVSELDFSHLNELEMVLALLKDIRSNQSDSVFLNTQAKRMDQFWKFKDCRGKTIAESLLEQLKLCEEENLSHFQDILVDFLDVSGVEVGLGNDGNFDPLKACLIDWLNSFRSAKNLSYSLSKEAMTEQVNLKSAHSKVQVESYKQKLKEIAPLEFQETKPVSLVNQFFSNTQVSAEERIFEEEKRHAKNAAIYFGGFFEISAVNQYVKLPTDTQGMPSLLEAVRDRGLSDLYIKIVARLVSRFGLEDPVQIVTSIQEAKKQEKEDKQKAFVAAVYL